MNKTTASFLSILFASILFYSMSSQARGISCRANQPKTPVNCLACNLKYEIGMRGASGGRASNEQRAVIYTVYNRALNRHGGYGPTLCNQVYAKNQFSWTRKDITPSDPYLTSSELAKYTAIVQQVMGEIEKGQFGPAACSMFYHTIQKGIGKMADYPKWSVKKGNPQMEDLGAVGPHYFMRPKGQKCIDNGEGQKIASQLSADGIDSNIGDPNNDFGLQRSQNPDHYSNYQASPNWSLLNEALKEDQERDEEEKEEIAAREAEDEEERRAEEEEKRRKLCSYNPELCKGEGSQKGDAPGR